MNTGEFIEQRRIAAGLTFWQLAHQLGLNADFVRHLSEGAQLDQLALGTILRLCRLLDIDIDQLLAGRRPARPSEPAADDVKVEAAIVRDGGVATREDLALALKWPLEPLEVALRILERRLQPSGIRLRQTGWNSYAGGVLLLAEGGRARAPTGGYDAAAVTAWSTTSSLGRDGC